MLALLALAAVLADTVRYQVAFPNAVHHEAEITVTFPAVGRDTLEIWMSRSSPGRYALHEFAKNVYAVRATDGRGRALRILQRDPYRWLVVGGRGTVRFSYTLFADRADGTYSQIDATHAHLNMPATFAWAKGLAASPIAIRFTVPEGSNWRPATQLAPTPEALAFTAPDLQYFMDSPTELSALALRSWTVTGAGGTLDTIRLAVHHAGTDAELDTYAEQAKKVVAEEIAIYGETARYDHGTYTFIADYLPWASGDGMEHRNSTILSSSGSLARASRGLLGTLAHEFFHSWNIERIRPRNLEPFDFTKANPSDALWFGEGFTSYYDGLVVRRTGVDTDEDYGEAIASVVNAVSLSPGRAFFSPMEMSLQAPFVDAATSIDPTNRANTFISYYTWGEAIGLGLDLTLRSRFPGKSLDGYMQKVWQEYGRPRQRYVIARPYTVDDLERTLGVYAGDRAFARDFFARYVRGREVVDYSTLLGSAGFAVRPANPNAAFFGLVQLEFDSLGAVVRSATLIGSPLYEAGVGRGDRIFTIGGLPLRSEADWQAVKAAQRPGDVTQVSFEQRGMRRTARLGVALDPRITVVPVEKAGGELTAAQQAFRADWLGSKAGK